MLKVFFSTLCVVLSALALLVFVFDPFFVYHKPIANLKEVQKIYQYQVPGVLRNFDYDGVLLGSSVVMSINADDLAKKYQCKKVVKAVASSSPASTLKYFLDLSLDSHDVKYIFYGMDVFSFHKAPHNTGMPEEVAFIINKNPFDDVGYIWNGDILAVKIPDMIRTSMNPDYDPGMAYGFMQWTPTGTKRVLDNYKQHIEQLDEAVVEFMDRVNNEGIDFLYQE